MESISRIKFLVTKKKKELSF